MEIKEAIYDDRELPPAPGTHKLAIPAPFVMWMRHASDDRVGRPMYNTMFCRTKAKGNAVGTNDLNIQMSSGKFSVSYHNTNGVIIFHSHFKIMFLTDRHDFRSYESYVRACNHERQRADAQETGRFCVSTTPRGGVQLENFCNCLI